MSFISEVSEKYQIAANADAFISKFKKVKTSASAFISWANSVGGGWDKTTDKHITSWINTFYKAFSKKAEVDGSKLKIWRIVSLDSISELDLKALGASWTWDKSSLRTLARTAAGEDDENKWYVLVADVDAKNIDFEHTLYCNLSLPQETETFVPKGKKVTLYEIYQFKKPKNRKKFTPPIRALAF